MFFTYRIVELPLRARQDFIDDLRGEETAFVKVGTRNSDGQPGLDLPLQKVSSLSSIKFGNR